MEARLAQNPTAAPPAAAWSDDLAYTRVVAEGVYLHERETLVQAVTERGPGFWVLTPLDTGERIILVNRGFVPPERRDAGTRRVDLTAGRVRVAGLLRASEPRGGFLRSNAPAEGRWYSRDVQAIAQARSLDDVAPYFIDADAAASDGEYPAGGLTVVRFRNTHLSYALTWLGLSLLSLIGAATISRHRRALSAALSA